MQADHREAFTVEVDERGFVTEIPDDEHVCVCDLAHCTETDCPRYGGTCQYQS